MGILASCWLIIEDIIIPDGFLKWFYLSFYIHPIFLFFCWIFLWLRSILKYLSVVFLYPLKIISFACSFVFKFFKNCVICVFSFTRLTNNSDETVEDQIESFELVRNCNENHIITSYCYLSLAPISCQIKGLELEDEKIFKNDQVWYEDENTEGYSSCMDEEDKSVMNDSCSESESSESTIEEENLDEYMPSSSSQSSICSSDLDHMNQCSSLVLISSHSQAEDEQANEYSPYIWGFNSLAVVEREELNGCYHQDSDSDEFYDKYSERMGWFDVLNHDRTRGINAILKEQVGLVLPDILWSKSARKSVLRSIESDLELVYVAQSCLSWEALHRQYLKVEALASSTSQNGIFHNNVAAHFQQFQVLLERFMEDERCQAKRVPNYVSARFSHKSLLQVPKISGFFELEREQMKNEAINVKEVLKAIERCIEAFWIFVKTDDKKPWWKFRSSFWTCPPVEDPRDLNLLADLTRKLQKKELWMRDSQGKERCWFKRVVKDVEESQRKEMLFTKIELKLISRVLQLPVLSSPQLKWCQQKLDSIHFHQGHIVRPSTSAPLFPP